MIDIYLSVDIESDGPIPGKNSMLSLGAVAIDINKKIHGEFEVNLELLPEATPDPNTMEFWGKNPEAWKVCRENIVSPEDGMKSYREFLKQLPSRPIFMGYPACFDFMFHHWYLIYFTGKDPCGFSGLDLKSYAAGLKGLSYRQSTKRNFPKIWFENMKHDHTALTDARGQAVLGINMLREGMEWKK